MLRLGAIDAESTVPKHRQVVAMIRAAIVDGRLRPGDELPSTRELARELGVGRNTVISAYELLLGEAVVTSRGGAGTFVSSDVALAQLRLDGSTGASDRMATVSEPRPLSGLADIVRVLGRAPPDGAAKAFRPSSPAVDAFPYAAWTKISNAVLKSVEHEWMSEGDPRGHLPLRKAIARHVHAFRSTPCSPERVVITTGAQVALYLCAMVLLEPSDPVWVEEPVYRLARLAFRSRTERVIPVPVDDAGIDIELGKKVSPRPRVIYTTPVHQWPSGVAMTLARKTALLEFAAEHRSWIVEDDYDGDLRFDRRTYTSLHALDEACRVIHVGSFTKTLSPGLRIGYLILPPDLVDAFVAARQIVDRFPNPIAQAILAEFIDTGAYARHVYAMRSLYHERHELLASRIASKLRGFLDAEPATGGTFTVTKLAPGLDDFALARAFQAQGYESVPLSSTYWGVPARRGLLLGHAIAKPEEIRRGVDALERIAEAGALPDRLSR